MKYSDFKYILETMQARENTEKQLYEVGLDITNIPNDLFGCVMRLFDEIYPESKGEIECFCYDLDYGHKYKGDLKDEFGRVVDFWSIYGLYNHLKKRELSAWIHAEPYGIDECLCADGHYLGIDFWVNWNGFAPCVYLDVGGIERAESILMDKVHGGITYIDKYLPFKESCYGKYIGWDYAHHGDYDVLTQKGKKWTTHQMIVEIQEAIDTLKEEYKNVQFQGERLYD